MYFLERFNRETVRHLLVIYYGSACIGFIESIQDWVMGLTLTHPCIISCPEEFSSLSLSYVYNDITFDDGKLEGDIFEITPLSQYTIRWSVTSLFINQCHFTSNVFECFGFIPEFINNSVVELSFLRGVADFLWYNESIAGCTVIAILPLLKEPHVSASSNEDSHCRFYYTLCG